MPTKKPEITITYCKPCGYEKRALELADALRHSHGMVVNLVAGKGGVFQVSVGDRVIAKRLKTGFPSAQDVVATVKP